MVKPRTVSTSPVAFGGLPIDDQVQRHRCLVPIRAADPVLVRGAGGGAGGGVAAVVRVLAYWLSPSSGHRLVAGGGDLGEHRRGVGVDRVGDGPPGERQRELGGADLVGGGALLRGQHGLERVLPAQAAVRRPRRRPAGSPVGSPVAG